MTFQPPPPPPGGNPPPPPPPPPGQWGPPPGGGYGGGQPAFDPKNVNQLDWGILGAGFLAFIFSFFAWFSYDSKGCGKFGGCISVTQSAWSGFFPWFGVLLALIGSALVAMEIFAPQVKLPIANRLAGLGAYALSALFVLLSLFVIPGLSYGGVDVPDSAVDDGLSWGIFAGLILVLGGLVLSLMRLQQTGTKLPGALGNLPNIGAKGPQGGIGGPGNPPPPPGYGPPPGP